MTAARYDITIDQGSDFALELIVKENGLIKDLKNTTPEVGVDAKWAVRSKYRKTLDSTTSFMILGTNFDKGNTGTATGKITLTHAYNANPTAVAGTYFYDVELVQYDDTTGSIDPGVDPEATYTTLQVLRLLQGTLTLRREVTR
jgi:hypothetical protein